MNIKRNRKRKPEKQVKLTMSVEEVDLLSQVLAKCMELDDQEFGSLLSGNQRTLLESLQTLTDELRFYGHL
jgi:hypothetical protein